VNVDFLLRQIAASPTAQKLLGGIAASNNQGSIKYVKNCQGSFASVLFSSLYYTKAFNQGGHIIICNSAEEAAYFHNNIENLINPIPLYYLPSSYKNPKNYVQLNPSHTMLRSEALTAITKQTNFIVVTYPEALIEKVPQAASLQKNTITIKQGEEVPLDTLMEMLVDLGFTRTDFVYEPGQFAMRGGIFDLYSFGNDKPYRLELFGNTVDSIRLIDPETQLSQKRLLQVTIIPNVETQFENETKIALTQSFPTGTTYWVQNNSYLQEKIEQCWEELLLFLQNQSITSSNKITNSEDENHSIDITVAQLAGKFGLNFPYKIYTYAELPEPEQEILNKHFAPVHEILQPLAQSQVLCFEKAENHNETYTANSQNQPAFNRNFNLIIANLKEYIDKNYTIYLFADNPRQLERLHGIFTDLNTQIQFINIPHSIHEGFIDHETKMVCYTDHQIFQRYHKYKIKQAYNKNKAITMRALRELQPGDYVTHIDHGVGVYSGLQKIEVAGKLQEAVRIVYKDSDVLYVNINSLHKIAKFTGKEGTSPKINKLGTDTWNKLKEKTKTKVKEVAFDLIKLYAQRKASVGFSHAPDNYMQAELEASFIYEDTPDQNKATLDVKRDMESESPMDRLVCGDVGFGKTEVAIRAAFKTCCDSKQAAVLVPTTILAFQHYKTFKDRLKDFPVTVDYINRFKSSKEKKDTFERLAEGKIDIIIGTHALLGKDVKYKNLGVLIIDEEQKFGVGHKEKIKTLKLNVDCLTLTATPIPRTLQFSLMGARDLSIINTAPPNRQPIETELKVFQEDFIRDAIYYETERGGQVFFIHNRVASLAEMATLIKGLCPDLMVGTAHGQMEGDDLEETILDFIDKKYDVLVCTNIVESGVDISNVNTIIVNNAHQFGLSDLHQLRGRVGRSNKKAFCYLLAPPLSTLPNESKRRLQVLEQHSELGSGFQIAMRDLDIRGAGNMLGGEQSGFMNDIGFETYQKILNEAIRELKRTKFANLFKAEINKEDNYVSDCTIDTDLEILIPDAYVENIAERLSLYSRLDNCETDEDLTAFSHELNDRFGAIPPQVQDLFYTVRCRKLAVGIGFEKIILKNKLAKCFFVNQPDSPYFESEVFKKLLDFVQTQTNKATLKQTGRVFLLTLDPMPSMEDLQKFLQQLHTYTNT
jgi:transcription-repair coupling factor (superfamily II helicase)